MPGERRLQNVSRNRLPCRTQHLTRRDILSHYKRRHRYLTQLLPLQQPLSLLSLRALYFITRVMLCCELYTTSTFLCRAVVIGIGLKRYD